MRIVAVHASAALGPGGPEQIGSPLGAADPHLHEAIAAAVGRVLRTGRAEIGLEVSGAAGRLGLSLFPAGGPAPETVSCVFGAAPANSDGFAGATVVESTPDAVVSTDREGIIRGWNPGAERLYGYTPAEAVGESITLLEIFERREQWSSLWRGVSRERAQHRAGDGQAAQGRYARRGVADGRAGASTPAGMWSRSRRSGVT